jgi:hypothetical protein
VYVIDATTASLFSMSRPHVREVADALRLVVQETLPMSAHELFFRVALGYAPSPFALERVLSIAVGTDHAILALKYGVGLSDPAGLAEASGGRMRSIFVREVADARRPEIRALMIAGWDAGLAGLAAVNARRRERRLAPRP